MEPLETYWQHLAGESRVGFPNPLASECGREPVYQEEEEEEDEEDDDLSLPQGPSLTPTLTLKMKSESGLPGDA